MGNTAIGQLALRSSREHCHRELAVGLVGNTAIRRWCLRPGREHCHRELAVVVEAEKEEEDGS